MPRITSIHQQCSEFPILLACCRCYITPTIRSKNWLSGSGLDVSGAIIRYEVTPKETRRPSFHRYMHLSDNAVQRKRKRKGSSTSYSMQWTDFQKPNGSSADYNETPFVRATDAEGKPSGDRYRVHYLPSTWTYGAKKAPFIFLGGDTTAGFFLPIEK